MKHTFFITALLSLALSSCSQETNALQDMSPEEIATYIIYGFKDKISESSEKEDVKLTVDKVSADPVEFDFAASSLSGGQMHMKMKLTVETKDNCEFIFTGSGSKDGENGTRKVAYNLRYIESGRVENSDIYLNGVQLTCIPPTDGRICDDMRLGSTALHVQWLRLIETKEAITAEQDRLNSTIDYFRKEVCTK